MYDLLTYTIANGVIILNSGVILTVYITYDGPNVFLYLTSNNEWFSHQISNNNIK